MSAEKEVWPDYLMIRDTGLHDDAGGLGQRIFTTAGAGYKKVKYIRADIAERDAALRAADNRDAAGVERQPDGYMAQWAADQLRSNKYVSCHLYNHQNKVIHGDGKEAVPFYFWPPAPAAVPAGEAVAWLASDGEVFTDKESADRHSKVWGVNPLLTPLYTTPPAPVQAAPQEGGDSHAFKNFHHSLCARFGYTHDENDWRRDLVSLEEHIARMAANPSACELGAVLKEIRAAADSGGANEGQCYNWWRKFEAALQHRGDSRGGETTP